MSRKVFLSVLGSSQYGECIYIENSTGYKSKPVRYIQEAIIEKTGRGVTIFSGKKGFGKRGEVDHEIDIVYTVITRLEISKLKSDIDNIDENAFVVFQSINDTKGGMVKKRPLH